jgi:hypothetical protein
MKRRSSAPPSRGRKSGASRRPCNLCSRRFSARGPYQRFCAACRATRELLRFSEIFPELDLTVMDKAPA